MAVFCFWNNDPPILSPHQPMNFHYLETGCWQNSGYWRVKIFHTYRVNEKYSSWTWGNCVAIKSRKGISIYLANKPVFTLPAPDIVGEVVVKFVHAKWVAVISNGLNLSNNASQISLVLEGVWPWDCGIQHVSRSMGFEAWGIEVSQTEGHLKSDFFSNITHSGDERGMDLRCRF